MVTLNESFNSKPEMQVYLVADCLPTAISKEVHVSWSLNSLKGVFLGIIWGSIIIGASKADTRSLDQSVMSQSLACGITGGM